MDDLATYNKERWEALAGANVLFSRPMLDLDAASARAYLDPEGLLGEVAGEDVLCLASGGGQQSAAFGLLGAKVTVLDLCETQLERDRQAAARYGLPVRAIQGDMRDLSAFGEASFDVVWHAHSINFVPDAVQVFRQVARVLRPGGLYYMTCHNPYVMGIDERDWNGEAYPLARPYVDGAEEVYDDPYWEVWDDVGNCERVRGPKEFRHALGTVINGLVELGFVILHVREEVGRDPDAEPGTWDHFIRIAPPYLRWWTAYRPDVCREER
jgi:SAM-dependent methyltransferase